MPKWRCKTCSSTYFDTLIEEKRYFHACAPVPNPDLQPDPSKPDFDPRETVERADKRNENVNDIVGPGGGGIISPGKGREQIEPLPWEPKL